MAIHAQDVNELSQATSAGVSVGAGTSLIRASDFTTLYSAAQSLWTAAHLGPLPVWSSGVTPGGPSLNTTKTPIYGSDIVDLRLWLNAYQISQGLTQTGWTYTAGQVIVTNRFYDARGLLQAETVPHLLILTVPGQFNSWNKSNPTVTYTYDGLKRRLTRVEPDGTSTYTWAHADWNYSLKDPNSHARYYQIDALGRTTAIFQYTGTTYPYPQYAQTFYSYDRWIG